MTNRHDILQRLSSFMDALSPEARDAFERDIDGVISYAGVGVSPQTANSIASAQAHAVEVENTFATQLFEAARRSFSGFLINTPYLWSGLAGVNGRQLAIFVAWAHQYFGPDIESLAAQDTSPVQFEDALLMQALAKVLRDALAVEKGSKAELRISGTLPKGLSLEETRDIVTVLPKLPMMRLALNHLPKADNSRHPDTLAIACKIVASSLHTINDETSKRWFLSIIAHRLGAAESLILILLALEPKADYFVFKKSPYALLLDVALDLFDDGKLKILKALRFPSSEITPLLQKMRRLGHALFVLTDLGKDGKWSERANASRAELGAGLLPVLERSEADIRTFLLASNMPQPGNDNADLDRARLGMEIFTSVDKDPRIFAVQSVTMSMKGRLTQTFDMGVERIFDKLQHATGENRQRLAGHLSLALDLADMFFADNYPKLMRQRMKQEMNLQK